MWSYWTDCDTEATRHPVMIWSEQVMVQNSGEKKQRREKIQLLISGTKLYCKHVYYIHCMQQIPPVGLLIYINRINKKLTVYNIYSVYCTFNVQSIYVTNC